MLLKSVNLDELRRHALYSKGLGNLQHGTLVFFLVTRENTGFCVWRVDCLDGVVPPGGQVLGYFSEREEALEKAVDAVVQEKVALYGTQV